MPDESTVQGGATTALLIFPCNGNGVEALDCLGNRFRCLGFVDDTPAKQAAGAHGHRVFDRGALRNHPGAAILAVPGGPHTYRGRRALIESLGVTAERFARVVHPGARVSPLATLGRNVLLMAGVVVTSNAVIGDHVLVMPNTVIHHDVVIGDACLIGANVTVAGGVTLEPGCYVASGSSIMHGLTIGAGALVGLGSTVIRSVGRQARVAGSPARPLPESE